MSRPSPTALTDVDAGVRSTSDGARLLTVINAADAPQQSAYNITLPAGATLVLSSADLTDESNPSPDTTATTYLIMRNGPVIGDIQAPWATDANGNAVPTTYSLQGTQLIQTVDFTSTTAFPVVADPKVSFGWWIYIRWSKGEAQWVHGKIVAGTAVAAVVCTYIPNNEAKGLCLAVSLYVLNHLSSVFAVAAAKDQCVELKFFYTPLIYRVRTYDC